MGQRTVLQLRSAIMREVRGQCTPLEAQEALQDAINSVDAKCNWEFLLKSAHINIEPTYAVGTVAVSAGGTAVTGTSTVWDGAWKYKTIKFASRPVPFRVTSFGGNTTATLQNALSGSTAITADTYLIYQDRYALPADCEPGRDLFIRGPNGSGPTFAGVITKKGRTAFEEMYPYSGGPVAHYTDDEFDETNRVGTIKFGPNYPVASGEYQIVYYGKLTVPTTDAAFVPQIPESFERMLIDMAAFPLMRRKNQQGWLALQAEAEMLMNRLYQRYAASSAYDTQIGGLMDMPDLVGMSSLLYTRNV